MSEIVQARSGYTLQLANFIAGSAWYAHLYTNDPALSEDTALDDFVEATHEGYAPLVMDRWTPPLLQGGRAVSLVDPLIFAWGGLGDPLPIRGYYVTDGDAGPLVWSWRRPDPPHQFTAANPTLIIYCRLTWPPGPTGGAKNAAAKRPV